MQTSFAIRVRESQADGSLEILLSVPLPTFQIIGYLALYPIVSAVLRALALILCGSFLGARLSLNPIAFLGTLVISMVPFAALGLISAAVGLVFKRADPLALALGPASYPLCGGISPVAVLPPALPVASTPLPAPSPLAALPPSALTAPRFSHC